MCTVCVWLISLISSKVYTWSKNQGRVERSVSECTLLLWGLPFHWTQEHNRLHFLPALCHPTLWGVLLLVLTARKYQQLENNTQVTAFTQRNKSKHFTIVHSGGHDHIHSIALALSLDIRFVYNNVQRFQLNTCCLESGFPRLYCPLFWRTLISETTLWYSKRIQLNR